MEEYPTSIEHPQDQDDETIVAFQTGVGKVRLS
jgi:hypothetical protein